MPETLRISAREAAQMAAAEQRQMNNGRQIDRMPAVLEQFAETNKIYLYNVGPWSHRREMGSLGAFYIPACEDGKEYSRPLTLPGIVTEPYPVSENQMALHQEDGGYIAEQILGVGKMRRPDESLAPLGVFISTTNPPGKAEIARARAALDGYYRHLVQEADAAWAQGPKMAEETIQPKLHFLAARRLNLTETECPWLKNAATAADRKNCDGCGTPYAVGIILCPQCRYILDPEKFSKHRDRFQLK